MTKHKKLIEGIWKVLVIIMIISMVGFTIIPFIF